MCFPASLLLARRLLLDYQEERKTVIAKECDNIGAGSILEKFELISYDEDTGRMLISKKSDDGSEWFEPVAISIPDLFYLFKVEGVNPSDMVDETHFKFHKAKVEIGDMTTTYAEDDDLYYDTYYYACCAIRSCRDCAEGQAGVQEDAGGSGTCLFSKVVTAELSHQIKVAVWDAVRYSHIWWGVDEVLRGHVMESPIVQQAFADAVPMRKWMVDNQRPGYEPIQFTIREIGKFRPLRRVLDAVILCITHAKDVTAARLLRQMCDVSEINRYTFTQYRDNYGRNLLWYLTYRDDQQSEGGFACPCIERELLRLGIDPNHRNNIGLSWNDVRRHLIRPKV